MAGFWRIFKFSANSCDKKHLNYDKFTVRFYVLSCQKFFLRLYLCILTSFWIC